MRKHVTGLQVVLLTVGSTLGSGIFVIPALVASHVASPLSFVSVWIVAGLITLTGCMTHGAIAIHVPKNGGQYEFFKYFFGKKLAHVYGWAGLLNFNSGSIACIAIIAAAYLNSLCGNRFDARWLATGLILFFTISNVGSIKLSDSLQVYLTLLRIAIVLGLATWTLINTDAAVVRETISVSNKYYSYVLAVMGALWAYDGWNNFTYMADEIIDIRTTLRKAIPLGIGLVVFIFTFFNFSLVNVFSLKQISATETGALLMGSTSSFGKLSTTIALTAIIFCAFGSLNANIMACSRLPQSIGNDSKLFRWMGNAHGKNGVPVNALFAQAGFAIIAQWTIPFELLTISVVLTSRFFYILSGSAWLIIRRRMEVWKEMYIPAFIPLIFIFSNIILLVLFIVGIIHG